jgi:hypothetical protein
LFDPLTLEYGELLAISAATTAARSPFVNANPATAAANTEILRIRNIFSSPPEDRYSKYNAISLLCR